MGGGGSKMTDVKKSALEEFRKDIVRISKELEPWINDDVNIFEVLKITNTEIRHSNFLAWLLDPGQNHKLGDRVIKGFISRVIEKNSLIEEVKNYVDKEKNYLSDNYDFLKAETEWSKDDKENKIDIMLVPKDSADKKIVICIENKVNSKEHAKQDKKNEKECQTKRYRGMVETEYKVEEWCRLFVFLSPNGDKAKDEKPWATLSYEDIIEIIEAAVDDCKDISNKVKMFVEDYLLVVKKMYNPKNICADIYNKHMTALDLIFERQSIDDKELREICEGIFNRSQKELDLISENKPDKRILFILEFKERLLERLLKHGDDGENEIDIVSDKGCCSLSFTTTYLSGLSRGKKDAKYTVGFGDNPSYVYLYLITQECKTYETVCRKLSIPKTTCNELGETPSKDHSHSISIRLNKGGIKYKNLAQESFTYAEFYHNRENIMDEWFDFIFSVIDGVETKLAEA
jgi:hypothetical protein